MIITSVAPSRAQLVLLREELNRAIRLARQLAETFPTIDKASQAIPYGASGPRWLERLEGNATTYMQLREEILHTLKEMDVDLKAFES